MHFDLCITFPNIADTTIKIATFLYLSRGLSSCFGTAVIFLLLFLFQDIVKYIFQDKVWLCKGISFLNFLNFFHI